MKESVYNGNYNLTKALSEYKKHPKTTDIAYQDIKSKATLAIQDGLFDHHVSFAYVENGCVYYRTYFGKGWHKRRPNNEGWFKYLNALAFNIYTGKYIERRELRKVL